MSRKLPIIKNPNRVLIICEGSEEFDYLTKLKTLSVWNNSISVELKNAGSIDNIFALYNYYYSSGSFKLVVVFCDTEKEPYKQFLALKNKLNQFHGKKVAKSVVFFVNPCTLQVVLSHFEKVYLTKNSKTENAPLIQKLTGVIDYRATSHQRLAIMRKITAENYLVMKNNISGISNQFHIVPSTNINVLFSALEMGDTALINKLAKLVDS